MLSRRGFFGALTAALGMLGFARVGNIAARNRFRAIANRNLSHPERDVRDLALFVSGALGQEE